MFDRNGNDNSTYNQTDIAEIRKVSPTVADLVEEEYNRQKNNVELIASENYCSEAVMAAAAACHGSMPKDILESRLQDIQETRADITVVHRSLISWKSTAAISGEKFSTQIIM